VTPSTQINQTWQEVTVKHLIQNEQTKRSIIISQMKLSIKDR
jgi:hypothetical protein